MNDRFGRLPKVLAIIADLSEVQARFEADGGPNEVERQIEEALTLYPNHGVAMAARAWVLFARGEFAQAVQWFSRAIESQDSTVDFEVEWLSYRGGCRFRMGDWKNALRDHVRARDLKPENPRGHFVMGTTFRELGDQVSSVLSCAVAAYYDGKIPQDEIFATLVRDQAYADPERVEATLRVLCDPLDKLARVYRAELMAGIESPRSALYDLKVADALAPGDLGLMVRIEDLQGRGIHAGPPLYDVRKPAFPLNAGQSAFLAAFDHACRTRMLPRELQPQAFPVEKVFGPSSIVPPGQPWALPVHSVMAASVATLVLLMPHVLTTIFLEAFGKASIRRLTFGSSWVDSLIEIASTVSIATLLILACGWLVFGCYWLLQAMIWAETALAAKYPRLTWVWALSFIVVFIYGIVAYVGILSVALVTPVLAIAAGVRFAPILTVLLVSAVAVLALGRLSGTFRTWPRLLPAHRADSRGAAGSSRNSE